MNNKKNLLGSGLIIQAILLVPILLNSCVVNEKTPGIKITEATESVAKVNNSKSELTNVVFKSTDGGQTWQDISKGLPEAEQPVNLFAGESSLYLQVENGMYRSKSNLKTLVWEKENIPDPRGASIAFNRSGALAFNHNGQIYQKMPIAETWLPILANFDKHSLRTIFEASDGTVFLGFDHGLYKSTDKGKNWKQVQNKGWVMNIVESEGVLLATGRKGIMRSTDNGENWEWVISEGGVGIAVERIEGGFAAITANTESMSRRVRISLDKGKTWQAIDEGLRPSLFISSIKQMGNNLIIGHPDGIFRSSDMGKTWNSVLSGFDKNEDKNKLNFVTTWGSPVSEPGKVFRIHTSGNVVYAMAGGAGC